MSKYLLLLRFGEFESYSQQEMQDILQRYIDWTRKLKDKGVHIASEELKDTGRVLSVEEGKVVDGPFTETKEAVGGFYLIESGSYDEAVKIARECPHLQFNGVVEVREINPH